MGIRRITYLFDADKFRESFLPFISQLERNEPSELKKRIYDLYSNDLVFWPVLEDIGYFKNDIGREEYEFDYSGQVKFWILILLSSFCKPIDFMPADARTTKEILEKISLDHDTVLRLTWGKPLGLLLMRNAEYLSTTNRDDTFWPYWCQSYGSLGWLSADELIPLFSSLEKVSQISQDVDQQKIQLLLDTLTSGLQQKQGLLLGVSA